MDRSYRRPELLLYCAVLDVYPNIRRQPAQTRCVNGGIIRNCGLCCNTVCTVRHCAAPYCAVPWNSNNARTAFRHWYLWSTEQEQEQEAGAGAGQDAAASSLPTWPFPLARFRSCFCSRSCSCSCSCLCSCSSLAPPLPPPPPSASSSIVIETMFARSAFRPARLAQNVCIPCPETCSIPFIIIIVIVISRHPYTPTDTPADTISSRSAAMLPRLQRPEVMASSTVVLPLLPVLVATTT